MQLPNTNKIKDRIKWMRIIGTSVSGIVALSVIIFSFRATSSLDASEAQMMNISGEQQLIAQRLLTDAFKIDSYVRSQQWSRLKPTIEDLRGSTIALQENHKTILGSEITRHIQDSHELAFQDTLITIEQSQRLLVESAVELLKLAESIHRRAPYIDAQTLDRTTFAKEEITQAHAIFLPAMSTIVDVFEQQAVDHVTTSVNRSKFSMIVLLAVLAGIAIFIIEPTFLIVRKQLVELTNTINHAKRANAVRWRLLTNIGNESRPKITEIIGYANLLSDTTLSDPERKRLSGAIIHAATNVSTLSETMLDLSAIESGQLNIINEQCNLYDLLKKVNDDSMLRAQYKELNLRLLVDESCPHLITTDAKRLEQILHKIIDNAIYHTKVGHVLIKASLKEKQGKDVLTITVIDTGSGIAPDLQESLFDSVIQAEDALKQYINNTGLGLSISKDIAQALGGDLVLQSSSEKGTTFVLTIDPGAYEFIEDYGKIEEDENEISFEHPLKGRKALVIDGNDGSRILVEFILEQAGATVEFASSCEESIDAMQAAQRHDAPYNFVLVDMNLEAYEGYFTTIKLREAGFAAPIIALSACDTQSDREDSIQAGCNDTIPRPIRKDSLVITCFTQIMAHDPFNLSANTAA